MKFTHTTMSADGSREVHIVQCEFCGFGNQSFKPIKEELLDLANCPKCRLNSRGERDEFDMDAFIKSQAQPPQGIAPE